MAILMPGRKLRNLPMPLSETPEASRAHRAKKCSEKPPPGMEQEQGRSQTGITSESLSAARTGRHPGLLSFFSISPDRITLIPPQHSTGRGSHGR
jgi:hypothetical protein